MTIAEMKRAGLYTCTKHDCLSITCYPDFINCVFKREGEPMSNRTTRRDIETAFQRLCNAFVRPVAVFEDEVGSWQLHSPETGLYTVAQLGYGFSDTLFPFGSDLLPGAAFIKCCEWAVKASKVKINDWYARTVSMDMFIYLTKLAETRFAIVEEMQTNHWTILGVVKIDDNYGRGNRPPCWIVENFDRAFDDPLTAAIVYRLALQRMKQEPRIFSNAKPDIQSVKDPDIPGGVRIFKEYCVSGQLFSDVDTATDVGSVTAYDGNESWQILTIHGREDVPDHMARLRFKSRDKAGMYLVKNAVLHSAYREFYNKYRRIQ